MRSATTAETLIAAAQTVFHTVRCYHTAMPTQCNTGSNNRATPNLDVAQTKRVIQVDGFVVNEAVKILASILPLWVSIQPPTQHRRIISVAIISVFEPDCNDQLSAFSKGYQRSNVFYHYTYEPCFRNKI